MHRFKPKQQQQLLLLRRQMLLLLRQSDPPPKKLLVKWPLLLKNSAFQRKGASTRNR
jgi:hypothetical protein